MVKQIIEFIIEQLRARPKYTIGFIVGFAVFMGYNQYEVNCQQEKCIKEQESKIVELQKQVAIQKEVEKEIADIKSMQSQQNDQTHDIYMLLLERLPAPAPAAPTTTDP